MPRPALRSRSKKRKNRSLPGGRSNILYKKEKTAGRKCSRCGRRLPSLPQSTDKIRKLPRTQLKTSRLYGGQLCHSCLQSMLKHSLRTLQ